MKAKKILVLLWGVIMSVARTSAQTDYVFDRLTANALDSFIEELDSYPYMYPSTLDSNYYLWYDNYSGTKVLKFMKGDLHLILKQKRDKVWLGKGCWDTASNSLNVKMVKCVRVNGDHSVQMIQKPSYELKGDTLVVLLSTAYFRYGRTASEKQKRSLLAVSDWGIFRYLYSDMEKRWLLESYTMGGI